MEWAVENRLFILIAILCLGTHFFGYGKDGCYEWHDGAEDRGSLDKKG
jgi:hypothetical protein